MSRVILPPSLTTSSPSYKDGISHELETIHRIFGCELIEQVADILILKKNVIHSAQNMLHRFFYRKSLLKYDAFTVAMGTLLLASKIEEEPKILREIVFGFHQVYQMRHGMQVQSLEIGGIEYNEWKNELITTERYLLKELGFAFYAIENPHKYLPLIAKELGLTDVTAETQFLDVVMKLDICVRVFPQVLVAASVYHSHKETPIRAALLTWLASRTGVQESSLQEICDDVEPLLSATKVSWVEPLCKVEYIHVHVRSRSRSRTRFRDQPEARQELVSTVDAESIARKRDEPYSSGRYFESGAKRDRTDSYRRRSRSRSRDRGRL